MPKSLKRTSLLSFSLFLSLLFHGIELQLLNLSSVWTSKSISPIPVVEPWALAMTKEGKNTILKETFHGFSKKRGHSTFGRVNKAEQTEEIHLSAQHPDFLSANVQQSEIPFPKGSPVFFSKRRELSESKISLMTPPKKELSSRDAETPKEALNPHQITPPPLVLPKKLPRQILFTNPLPPFVGMASTLCDPFSIKSSSLLIPRDHILKTPSFLEKKSPSNSSFLEKKSPSNSPFFDTELLFIEEEEGSYVFALTLIPKEDLNLEPLKQNYTFLIDRGNSIQKERLNSTKIAVKKALEELNDHDQFNILVFDQKLEKLSSVPLSKTPGSLEKAHSFLNRIELGNFFTQKNLYKPLFLTVPFSVDSNELHTTILITDGDNLSSKAQTQRLNHDWTRLNQGKVSLYTVGISEDPQRETLEVIARLNRGKGIHSPTHKGMKRKLLKLMKSIGSPLAKNLSCHAISKTLDPKRTLELYPSEKNIPHLFLNEPYVLLGRTNSLDDFVLFIQGSLEKEWLHIKKTISFSDAKKAPPSLLNQVAENKSIALYQKYLEREDPQLLVEANKISQSYNLSRVFE